MQIRTETRETAPVNWRYCRWSVRFTLAQYLVSCLGISLWLTDPNRISGVLDGSNHQPGLVRYYPFGVPTRKLVHIIAAVTPKKASAGYFTIIFQYCIESTVLVLGPFDRQELNKTHALSAYIRPTCNRWYWFVPQMNWLTHQTECQDVNGKHHFTGLYKFLCGLQKMSMHVRLIHSSDDFRYREPLNTFN